MIKHILKIMKNEQKSNTWIMLELLLVFVVMWFCFDYLNLMIKRHNEPRGLDIKHTYMLNFGIKDEYKNIYHLLSREGKTDSIQELFANDAAIIAERLKQMSEIESVCFSANSQPFGFGNSMYNIGIDSVWDLNVLTRTVSPAYFDVFKINVDKRTGYDWENPSSKQVILGMDINNLFCNKPADSILQVKFGKSDLYKVTGISNRVKFTDYNPYRPIAFVPLEKWETVIYPYDGEISIRVKASADVDFIYKFTSEIKDKLDIGPYYFINMMSFEKQRTAMLLSYGFTDNFKNVFYIIIFIIVNVFLGVFGTFWFRTQSRQAEVGLRCAIGSSKKQIAQLIIGESLLMLFIASILATIIALILTHFDIVKGLGVPIVNHTANNLSILYFVINYLVVIGVLAIMVIAGTYFPAKRASSIQPSEALRAE